MRQHSFGELLLGWQWDICWDPGGPLVCLHVSYAIAETVVAIWAIIVPYLLAWSETSFIAAWLINSSPLFKH